MRFLSLINQADLPATKNPTMSVMRVACEVFFLLTDELIVDRCGPDEGAVALATTDVPFSKKTLPVMTKFEPC
jgi:hypothetical protein